MQMRVADVDHALINVALASGTFVCGVGEAASQDNSSRSESRFEKHSAINDL